MSLQGMDADTAETLTGVVRLLHRAAEAEIAIEQGETRYEGVTWTTLRQIAANQLIPLPEPARRGLINLARTSWPLQTGPSPWQHNSTPATSRDQSDPVTTRIAGGSPSPIRSLISA
jgi:hypothetical protein